MEVERFFLSKRYLSQLENTFCNRKQFNRERHKDYILAMLTTARQPRLRTMNHRDRIYDGLRPEYRHYVRRNDFDFLDELVSLTEDFEQLKRDEARQEKPHTSHMLDQGKDNYQRDKTCWRCKLVGHKRQ